MTSSKYLEYTLVQKESVLNKYERTVESIKEDIQAIKLWLEKQPHIPKNLGKLLLFLNIFMYF